MAWVEPLHSIVASSELTDMYEAIDVRNIKNPLVRYIELKTQRWIYEKQTSITYESMRVAHNGCSPMHSHLRA